MNQEHDANEIEHSRLESGKGNSPLPRRDEDILLDRLMDEPPVKKQVPTVFTISIIAVVLALAVLLFFVFRKPEIYTQQPANQQEAAPRDSSELISKRMRLGRTLDSLEGIVASNPQDANAMLALANTYYDGEYWDKAMMVYDHYLSHEPRNANARIDYAYTIAQVTANFKLAIAEIDSALAIEPDHVQGLFNAGLLALRANVDNKDLAIKTAKSYFTRAKDVAAKQGNTTMSKQIDEILAEMDKVANKPTAR